MYIYFIVKGRFPTEKAYGVTITETINSLSKFGHQISVLSVKSSYMSNLDFNTYCNQINFTEKFFQKLIRFLSYTGKSRIHTIVWKLYWKIILKKNAQLIIDSSADLYWIRDLDLIKYIPDNSNIVLELHSMINESKIHKITRKEKNKKIILAPISKKIFSSISKYKDNTSIIFSPMGINTDFSETFLNLNIFIQRIYELRKYSFVGLRVGYVGKFFPGGHSKGIEDLFALAKLNAINKFGYKISITGGSINDLKKSNKLIKKFKLNKTSISIKGHVQHNVALSLMKNLDVIVLPEPRSSKYVGFPLKCIEAVSSGRIVVAADCELYRDIFTERFQPYWYDSEVADSLNCGIVTALKDPQLINKIGEGINFANKFSWDSRTSNLLNKVKKP